MKILVTGGAGFIGSAVVRAAVSAGHEIINLDKLTYAANLNSLTSVADAPGYRFEKVDICDGTAVRAVLEAHQPDVVMHLAAESHVDRSIDGPADFIRTNIVGSYQMLETSLDYYRGLPPDRQRRFRFHHVSTDEVFGSLGESDPAFTAKTPYRPRSPYSASKAASDHLALSWHHTYGLPVVLSNCSNNYGPYQFPEKLIPLMIIRSRNRESLPVYGNGENIRDWLHVDDHACALLLVIDKGRPGESYLVGGEAEHRNIDVVRAICGLLDELAGGDVHADLITMVDDRPGHDWRYAINPSGIRDALGWQPSISFEEGLRNTVEWYLANPEWWEPLMRDRYDGGRLGVADKGRGPRAEEKMA
jgi:dTDP-glucose 4,6-dehydratase